MFDHEIQQSPKTIAEKTTIMYYIACVYIFHIIYNTPETGAELADRETIRF